jgi:hypothetical protein
VGKRNRVLLAPLYVSRYTAEILDRADLSPLIAELERQRGALMCVEASAAACHRSLIAARLNSDYGFDVDHFEPASATGQPAG